MVIPSPQLRDAFDNRINVFTLESGRPVIVADKAISERGIPQTEA